MCEEVIEGVPSQKVKHKLINFHNAPLWGGEVLTNPLGVHSYPVLCSRRLGAIWRAEHWHHISHFPKLTLRVLGLMLNFHAHWELGPSDCHFLFSHYQIGTPHYSPSLRSAFWAQQNMPILGVWHNNLLAHRIDSWGLIIHKCKNQCAHHPDRAPRVLSDQAGTSQERLGGPLQILGTNSFPCSIVNFPWLHWQQQHFLHTGTVQFLTSLHRV